ESAVEMTSYETRAAILGVPRRKARRSPRPAFRHPPKTAKKSRLQRNWRPLYILAAVAIDSASVLLAGGTAYAIRSQFAGLKLISPGEAALMIAGSCAAIICTALISGVYRSACRIPHSDQYRDAARAYLYAVAIIVCGMYLALGEEFTPRFTGFFLVLTPVFYMLGRILLRQITEIMQRRGYGRHNALIVNWNGTGPTIFDRFTMFPELGYDVRGLVCSSSGGSRCVMAGCTLQNHFANLLARRTADERPHLPCYPLEQIERAIESEGIERVFVPMVKPSTAGFSRILRACHENDVKLKVISSESEELLRFARVKDVAGIPLHAPPRITISRAKWRLKRCFDIAGSLLILGLLSPVFLVVALAILLEDGRPVFFRQTRGLSHVGTRFEFVKFRSMRKNAESEQRRLNSANETSAGLFFMKNDPRVTRVGKWIRKFSIDEFPQLINVLRGDMSLVGPRPLPLSDLENIEKTSLYADYYHIREKVRPGMTGLWQISGRREVPFKEMVLLDLYYFENQSIMFDLEILFATIPVVLFGRGAY
ncbi:MAG TPA: sugar transferase, partial [Bacteroidota bacterium]|nr:sugar transferase [Bacteroidota bacterium]